MLSVAVIMPNVWSM